MIQRLYQRTLTVAAGTALQVTPAQTDKCHAIGFPHTAKIHRLVVKQNGGTPVDFTVDLFDRDVCDPSGSSSAGSPPALAEDLARIIPQQSATAGNTVDYRSDEGAAFRNAESDPTNHVRKIYLRIVPSSPVDTTSWEVHLVCDPRAPV